MLLKRKVLLGREERVKSQCSVQVAVIITLIVSICSATPRSESSE
jgi:hypothetical protein